MGMTVAERDERRLIMEIIEDAIDQLQSKLIKEFEDYKEFVNGRGRSLSIMFRERARELIRTGNLPENGIDPEVVLCKAIWDYVLAGKDNNDLVSCVKLSHARYMAQDFIAEAILYGDDSISPDMNNPVFDIKQTKEEATLANLIESRSDNVVLFSKAGRGKKPKKA